MSRPRLALTIVAAAIIIAGIGLGAVISGSDAGPQPTGTSPTEATGPSDPTAKPPQNLTDPLTGGTVSDHPVVAAKVENIAAARPQVGLSQADITFIQEVEGAQTRLLAVYHSRFPKRVGPIRSARS